MLSDDTIELLRAAVESVADKKGFHINLLDVSALTSYTDVFLLCSAANVRQVAAIADAVTRRLKSAGRRPLHTEGGSGSEWVLIDFGEFIVHLFTEDKRGYYALDSLWGDAPRLAAGEIGLDGADVLAP
jgi:ribosome-associated protein